MGRLLGPSSPKSPAKVFLKGFIEAPFTYHTIPPLEVHDSSKESQKITTTKNVGFFFFDSTRV
jgi:hypothetical protein